MREHKDFRQGENVEWSSYFFKKGFPSRVPLFAFLSPFRFGGA